MNFSEEKNQLRWPKSVFVEEAAELFNEPHSPLWEKRFELLLEDAFVGAADSEPARQLAVVTPMWGQTLDQPPKGSPTRKLLADLIKMARDGEVREYSPHNRPYWSQRKHEGRENNARMSVAALQFTDFVLELEERGYLEKSFGKDCPDDPSRSDPSEIMARKVDRADLWPLSPKRLASDLDLFCDAIEVIHDLVARPRSRVQHSFNDCGWHYEDFSSTTGMKIYRWRINAICENNELNVRISNIGEDVGRMVIITDLARSDLIDSAASSSGSAGGAVRHAIALFRKRDADEHDKRSAIVSLAYILEERRARLKQELFKKDEGSLFQIANEFHIRHKTASQKADYDPVFLDWVFWWYLATIELTNQLHERESEE
ncbi:hypothetical protein [Brevibacterium sp.]|uniref:hypothetical protein n=1 Tax=Brevibacterium sp. TaxID=1701 RepID=UPI0028124729|nr:hypothetical protein [Brevibacterium sp.]